MAKRPASVRVADRGSVLSVHVSGDGIYCSTGTQSSKLALGALASVWRVNSSPWGVIGLAGDERCVVCAGGEFCGARAAEDGRLLWTADSGYCFLRPDELEIQFGNTIVRRQPESGEIIDSATVGVTLDNSAYKCGQTWVTSSRSIATGLDRSGATLWQRDLYASIAAPGAGEPTDASSRAVFINHADTPSTFLARWEAAMCGCNTSDGAIRWRVPIRVEYHFPNIDRGRVIVLHGLRFIVIDIESGAILVDREDLSMPFVLQPRPGIVRGDRIAFPHLSGDLAVIDIPSGELVNLYRGKKALWCGAVYDNGLLVGTGDGHLLVFDEKVWG